MALLIFQHLNRPAPVSDHVLRLGGRLDQCLGAMNSLYGLQEQTRLPTLIAIYWNRGALDGVDTKGGGPHFTYNSLLHVLDNIPTEIRTSLFHDDDALGCDRQEIFTDLAVSFVRIHADRDPSAVMNFAVSAIENGTVEQLHPRVRTVLSEVFHEYLARLRSENLDEERSVSERFDPSQGVTGGEQ
jgi:hypothetical protein